MIVHNFLNKNYGEDPIRFWEFQKFKDVVNDSVNLFVGVEYDQLPSLQYSGEMILCHFEEVYDEHDCTDDKIAPYCDLMLTISKDAAQNKPKRKYVYFPLNEQYLPENILEPTEKIYDVIYTGNNNHVPTVSEIYYTLPEYDNYVITSFDNQVATHSNVSYIKKLQLINQSKVAVTHNSHRGDTGQLKSRHFEAAFNKSLILCCNLHKDYMSPWFIEGEHYITYNINELKSTLDHVLKNYSDYYNMIENTYNYAMNKFTTKHFINDFIVNRKDFINTDIFNL